MNAEGTGILQQFNVGDAIDLASLLNIGSMSSDSQAHEIFAHCKLFSEPANAKEIQLKTNQTRCVEIVAIRFTLRWNSSWYFRAAWQPLPSAWAAPLFALDFENAFPARDLHASDSSPTSTKLRKLSYIQVKVEELS